MKGAPILEPGIRMAKKTHDPTPAHIRQPQLLEAAELQRRTELAHPRRVPRSPTAVLGVASAAAAAALGGGLGLGGLGGPLAARQGTSPRAEPGPTARH